MTSNDLKYIRKFHGHIGPYVVLGFIMGIYVKGYLENIDRILVYTNPNPPTSCILDGLQLSTGCTLGRNTIRVVSKKWLNKVDFYKQNRKISVTLKPVLEEKLKLSMKAALYYLNHSVKNNLFNIS